MFQPIGGHDGHQWFQRRRQKCLGKSEARAVILVFRSARKTQKLLRMLRSCFMSSFVEFRFVVSEKKSKMSQPIRGQDGPNNSNLVEDVEILLPFKFPWIPFTGFREAVEKVLVNQWQDGHLWFPIGLKTQNLAKDVEILLPVKFRWILFTVSDNNSNMSRPIRGQGGHLGFPIDQKKNKNKNTHTNLVLGVRVRCKSLAPFLRLRW